MSELQDSQELQLLQEMDRGLDQLTRNRLKFYRPYPKQRQFHEAGGHGKTFRLFFAGNQLGKSECGIAELAMHLTGLYPEWWVGKRFTHPILAWCGSKTNVLTKDILEAKLFGEKTAPGTGFIPQDRIGDPTSSHNIRDALERCTIKHVSGGYSTIVFKSYQQGDEAWQGMGVHVIHLDEEPDVDIWGEAIARVTRTGGVIMLTFTPRKGMSTVVREFFPTPNSEEKFFVRMELDEAMHEDGTSHLTDEDREKQRTRFPEYQRDARLRGLPMLGTGLIYPIDDQRLVEPPCQPGKHWRHIGALDIGGGTSPTAWVWFAIDPVPNVWHMLHCYKVVDPRIVIHAGSILANAKHVPFGWPHDANVKTHLGTTKKWEYQKCGVRMLKDPARFPKIMGGGNSPEDGISIIYDMMEEGRLKVAAHLTDWYDEKRTYHRQQGKILKEHDHLMDAMRYAIMCADHAVPIGGHVMFPHRGNFIYDPLNPDANRGRMSSRFPSREPHEDMDFEEREEKFPSRLH